MIRVVPPVLAPPGPPEPRLVHVSAVPGGGAIGLIDNGKAMAREIMQATAAALSQGGRTFDPFVQGKLSAGWTITPSIRDDVVARARIVLTGVGD